MPPFNVGQNAFSDFLEERPDIAYYSFQDQLARTPSQQRFFENQFQNIQNQYLGQLGRQLRAGNLPRRRFTDFLTDYGRPAIRGGMDTVYDVGPTPFQQAYYRSSPSRRGMYPSQFAPRTRFIPF